MGKKAETLKTDRRGFLKIAGLGSVAGGAVLVSGEKAEAEPTGHNTGKLGYQETDHVKSFYKSARF